MRQRIMFSIFMSVGLTVNAQNVTVQLNSTKQTIAGFGINNNWAPALTAAVADSLFDSTKGLGLSILRIGMGSDGNAFNGSSWNDIKLAQARGLKYVIGSAWTPPAGWKTNNSENDGGYLLPQYYGQWSDRLAAFPAKVKSGSGMDLYAMSMGNEPDFASCGSVEPCNGSYPTTLYNDTQVVNFVKLLGPKLHALNPQVKLMAPEASEWLHVWSNSSACCSEPSGKPSSNPLGGKGYDYGHALYKDATAWAQLDILGVHQYDSQVAEPWPSDVPATKPVWQTEMSGVKWWPEQGPSSDIKNGVAVAGWLHNALTVGNANAWCWWWWQATGATNEGLLLSTGANTKRHYTFGNFTRFIRPGYTRVDITGTIPANVLLSAYKGTNRTVVVVAINKDSTSTATVPITIAGGTASGSMTPWVTSASDNLASKTAVPVSGGVFTATLASRTVTTFVGVNLVAIIPQGRRNLDVGAGETGIHVGFAGSRARLLNVPIGKTWRFDVFDMAGRVVVKEQGEGRGNAAVISLDGLRSGAYVAALRCGGEMYRTMVTLEGQR
jgi:glucuronoarabinoxylan endo-1,4-beta-xylanase